MMGETPIVRMANQIRSMEAEIEQLRADLDLRNQTALDRKKAIVELEAEIDRLWKALTESVKLQTHYAGILNQYDGGQRMQFYSTEAWLERLRGLVQHMVGEYVADYTMPTQAEIHAPNPELDDLMKNSSPVQQAPGTPEFTPIMRAASEAAARVDGWSDAKKDAAERIVKSGAYKPADVQQSKDRQPGSENCKA